MGKEEVEKNMEKFSMKSRMLMRITNWQGKCNCCFFCSCRWHYLFEKGHCKITEQGQVKEVLCVEEFRQRRILTSTLPEMLPVPHLEYGFHPCSQPVHHKTWHGTLNCPQPKHTVGRRRENKVTEWKEKWKHATVCLWFHFKPHDME